MKPEKSSPGSAMISYFALVSSIRSVCCINSESIQNRKQMRGGNGFGFGFSPPLGFAALGCCCRWFVDALRLLGRPERFLRDSQRFHHHSFDSLDLKRHRPFLLRPSTQYIYQYIPVYMCVRTYIHLYIPYRCQLGKARTSTSQRWGESETLRSETLVNFN